MRLSLLAVLGLVACTNTTEPEGHSSPADAKIVTADVVAFWDAFPRIRSVFDTVPMRDYLEKGTVGLQDFTRLRWKNATILTQAVWTLRDYYGSIRETSLAAAQMEPQIRATFAVADTLIDDAIFPDVYLAIGAMATGGTTSDHGLLIGVEMFSKAPNSPTDVLSPWQQSVIRSNEVLPAIVAHELTHYQQRCGTTFTLLGQSIREGTADFIGRMLSGRSINEPVEAYGLAHEAQLWAEFQPQMEGTDYSNWLYNGGDVTTSSTRPADLGYFVGARIVESYYRRATNKHAAIQEILCIRDYHVFLAASGYTGQP